MQNKENKSNLEQKINELDGVGWLGIAEACRYLSVSNRTLYTYMKNKKLPYYYLADSKHRRVKKEDLDSLLIKGDPDEVE